MIVSIELRVLNADRSQSAVLGDVESLTLSPVICDAGTIEFSYPKNGANWAAIKDRDEFSIQVYIDGVLVPELEGLVKEVDGDDIEESSVWKFTGFFNNGRLAEAETYPAGWPNSVDPEHPNLRFTTQSAGAIIRTLMQQAQSRGTLTDIDYSSFSSTHDSNGTPWNKTISIEYAPQVDYLTVFRNLYAEQDMVEFQMRGNQLFAYVSGSMSIDHTQSNPPLVFRRGRDLLDSPRKRSTRGVATAILVAGDQGVYREVKDDAAIAGRRRIEASAKSGQITDEGTLIAYGTAELSRTVAAKMEKTHGLVFEDPASPRPIKNFWVGDWAYSDMGSGLERLRIKQWVLKLNADGTLTGSVTLNDFFAEQGELLNKRIQGIIGGSTITGASRAVENVPADIVDTIAPSTPTGLSVTSQAYLTGEQTYAQATASWLQVTTNSDGTILEDLERYAISWRQPNQGSEWNYLAATSGTTMSWSPLAPGEALEVRVRAEDRSGNVSPWSSTAFTSTGTDATPPPQPTAPIGDNYLGLVRFRWDGKFLNNAPRPSDLRDVVLFVSNTNNFSVTATTGVTRVGSLITEGSLFVKQPTGVPLYGKFVAYDRVGNASPVSAQGSATSQQVVSADIFDGAVGSSKLADLAVTTAKINDLAVNNAKIGDLSVGKLTAGVMNAEVTVGGRFTTALSGVRTEINSLGIFRFDSAGNATVAIDANGALITGRYRTAATGRRIEIGATSANVGRIDFWSPDGNNGFIRAWTEASGVEAIQMGMIPPGASWHTLWNRININSSSLGEYSTFHSGTLELAFDGGTTQKDSNGASGVGAFKLLQSNDRGTNGGHLRMQIDRGGYYYWDQNVRLRMYINSQDMQFSDEVGNLLFWANGTEWNLLGNPQTTRPRLHFRRSDGYMIHGSNIAGAFREYFNTGHTKFFMDNGWLEFQPFVGNNSVGIKQFNKAGYGGLWKIYQDNRGTWYEARSWADDGFYGIRAANFEVNSDMREKTGVTDAGVDSYLSKMTKASPKKFKRKGDFEATPEPEPRGPDGTSVRRASAKKAKKSPLIARQEELGLIAQELPDEVRLGNETEGYGYGSSQMFAFLWGAVRELSAQVEDLKMKGGKK